MTAVDRWWVSALCAQTDPDLFAATDMSGSNQVRAKAICRRCSVRSACAAEAIAAGEEHGTWGGMSPREIQAARKVAACAA